MASALGVYSDIKVSFGQVLRRVHYSILTRRGDFYFPQQFNRLELHAYAFAAAQRTRKDGWTDLHGPIGGIVGALPGHRRSPLLGQHEALWWLGVGIPQQFPPEGLQRLAVGQPVRRGPGQGMGAGKRLGMLLAQIARGRGDTASPSGHVVVAPVVVWGLRAAG